MNKDLPLYLPSQSLKNGDVAFVSGCYKEEVQGWYISYEFPETGRAISADK